MVVSNAKTASVITKPFFIRYLLFVRGASLGPYLKREGEARQLLVPF